MILHLNKSKSNFAIKNKVFKQCLICLALFCKMYLNNASLCEICFCMMYFVVHLILHCSLL